MAKNKPLAGFGIEEVEGAPQLQDSNPHEYWADKSISLKGGNHVDKAAAGDNPPAKRRRRWSLWIAAAGVFALLAAKLCTPGASPNSLKKREWEGIGLDEGGGFSADLGGDMWDVNAEPKAVVTFAPFMAADDVYFEGTPHLKPQTVPLAQEQSEDLSIDVSGIPRAWAAYLDGKKPEETVPQEQETPKGGESLDWLTQFAIPGSQGSRPVRVQIRSGDAMKVAREISNRYFGTVSGEEPKQPAEAVASQVFNRLVGRLGSGVVTVVTEANRLSTTTFDARSRNLRAQLALLEIGNEVGRLKERQKEALKNLEQAKTKLEAGDGGGEAEAERKEAIQKYKSLLSSEKYLMGTLVQLASRWAGETTKILTSVASIITSPAMADIEEISNLKFSVFNIPSMVKKVYDMSDVVQREARSKNPCRLVEDVAAKRAEDINVLASSIELLSSAEFDQVVQRQNAGLTRSRGEFRSTLMKKKQDSWLADVI
ncbi:hypothetical protein, conserved [Eimeria maxima]|uniref:Uncharacterized protein n=1 Tax=Eimeria maxima TaxID=5804 RepID=U6M8J3_EIMMA|nr:hypothetical protein, conserved [Eimeria maxima]CDJ60346.1 hypothetical protein, conserved [Eimeria maxima]